MTSEMHHKLKMLNKKNGHDAQGISCFFVQLLHFDHYEEGVDHVSITRMGLVGGLKSRLSSETLSVSCSLDQHSVGWLLE